MEPGGLRSVPGGEKGRTWKVLAERLENLSFSPEQKAWLRDLMVCLEGEEPSRVSPSSEAPEVCVCKICGERFFFRREAYGPEDRLLCPACGEVFSLPPRGEGKA